MSNSDTADHLFDSDLISENEEGVKPVRSSSSGALSMMDLSEDDIDAPSMVFTSNLTTLGPASTSSASPAVQAPTSSITPTSLPELMSGSPMATSMPPLNTPSVATLQWKLHDDTYKAQPWSFSSEAAAMSGLQKACTGKSTALDFFRALFPVALLMKIATEINHNALKRPSTLNNDGWFEFSHFFRVDFFSINIWEHLKII